MDESRKMILIVDPDSGWRYGFPKACPLKELGGKEFIEWLIANGYPKERAEFGAKYCRYWYEPEEE